MKTIVAALAFFLATPLAAADGDDPRLAKAREDYAKEIDQAAAAYGKSAEKSRAKLVKALESALATAEKRKDDAGSLALRSELTELADAPIFPAPPRAAAYADLIAAIGQKTVGADRKAAPVADLLKADYVVLYLSAHWCPPCRAFTPELVKQYPALKAANVEVVFASRDKGEDEMYGYMKEMGMPWRAAPFANAGQVISKYGGKGIPNVVVLNRDGTVFSKSYDGETYQGPQKPIDDLKAKLKIK